MHLFHYHLVTSRVRQVEARYVGKLAFELVARHGRIGEEYQSFETGTSWEELDAMGFKLRLTELERGAVNVVVQPGQWEVPRVDHVGLALDEDVLVCGDAREPKRRVAELIDRIDGLRAVNAGALETARLVEGLTPLLISVNSRNRVHAGVRFTGLPEPRW